MTASLGLRRVPRQARSRERVQRVLDTAEELLTRAGPHALTTTALAREAGISVGSLYQWFPDVDAVLRGLVERYGAEFRQVAAEFAAQALREPPDDPAGAALAVFADAFRVRPAFRALWFGGLRTEELREVARDTLAPIGEAFASVIATQNPAASAARIATVADTFVLVADALLRQAFRRDPGGDAALLAEASLLLRSYLEAGLTRSPLEDR
jgi:AcrR family transcriptional regulator